MHQQPSWNGSSCPLHAVRRRHRRAPTSYGWRGIPLCDCLQQVEKYDSDYDYSGDCSEGEVGEDEGEDAAQLVSTHNADCSMD